MHNDSYYINEVLNGKSEEAIFSLVQKYEKKIFNLCFRIIKHREQAEEIAQDAFLKSFRDLKKLDDPTKYEIWLSRIAYHLSIDVVRKKKRYYTDIDEVNQSDATLISGTVISLDQMDRKKAIEQILKEIAPEDAALITLFYLNEMQVREVADIMKMSVSNVKVKLMRTRKVLKERLNELFKDEVYELF